MAEMLATMVVTSREVRHGRKEKMLRVILERGKAQNDKEQLPILLLSPPASSVQ